MSNFEFPNLITPSLGSPSVISPSMSPSVMSPSMSPSVISPSLGSPSVMSPSVMSPSRISPSVISLSVISPSVISPSLGYSLPPVITPVLNYTLSPSLRPNLSPSKSPSVSGSQVLSVSEQNVYAAINNSNLPSDKKSSAINSLTTKFIIFLLEYSSLVSGIGAILYAIGTVVQIDITTIITNNTGRMIINFIIFISGVITVLDWLALDVLLHNITSIYNVSN